MEIVYATVAIMLILLLAGIPIAISIGLATCCGLLFGDLKLAIFAQKFFNTFDSFPLMAVPFFILAGDIMANGTLSSNLLAFSRSLVGHKKGGLAHITTITALFYGTLCGSAMATVAAVGGIMIPAMENDNYPKDFSCGLNAAAGSLGVMIPPSIPLVLYGSFGGVSVSDLFIAGIIPGIFIALCLMGTAHYILIRKNYGSLHDKMSGRLRLEAFRQALPALGVPVIILGGIYSGAVTPTEAGVLAVAYAFIVEFFITRVLNWSRLCAIVRSSMISVGLLFFIAITANGFGTLLIYFNVDKELDIFIHAITSDKYCFIFIMFLVYIIMGTFMEAAVSILILAPVIVPIAISYGINPVQFGIFTIVTLSIGFLTPPVGANLFVACSVGNIDIVSISKALAPFILTMMVAALIIAYIPFLSLCLF